MKKAIDEMRAWLEEKKEELMLPVKLSGYPPTKWHIERNEIIDSILAELEPKVTEWTPDRPCPKEGAALAGPGEEERKALLKWLVDYAERYSGLALSHSWAMIPVTEEDRKKWDKICAVILGHAQEGEKEEK